MEEISLRELIEILLRRKKLICLITIVSVLVAGIFSFFIISPKYEAQMMLMASNITDDLKLNENGNNIGNVENVLNAISKYPSMNLETYRQQIKAPEVIGKTIKDLKLEEDYTVEGLAKSITLETLKDTEIITIKMSHKDPKKAADIVNKLGENFVSFVSHKAKERANSSSEYIKSQIEIEKKNYDESLLELKEILSQPRGADELELELNAKLAQLTEFKTQLNELSVRRDALESGIKVANSQPSKGSGMVITSNTMDSQKGSMNVIFDDTGKILRIELAEVEASLNSIENKVASMKKDIEDLQIELQEKKHKESIVKQKVDIAQKTYESFVKKYEELRITESSKIGEASITVVSKAYPSQQPVSPRKALNMAISLVLGLMLGVFIAFFQEYWENPQLEVKPMGNKN